MIVASAEELELLYPGQHAATRAAEWIAQGVALAVVTKGAAGVSAWTSGAALRVEPVAVAVVDTVGAGDTFQAALLAALAERGAWSAAALRTLPVAAFSTRTAAITCSRRGADLPWRAELD